MGDFEFRYAHLGHCRTPVREAQRLQPQAHIAEIQAEHKERNAALHQIDYSHIPPLRVADRCARGRRKRK